MKHIFKYTFFTIVALVLFSGTWAGRTHVSVRYRSKLIHPLDSPFSNGPKLPYPFEAPNGAPADTTKKSSLSLNDPSNVKTTIEYNTETGNYDMSQKMGDMNFRNPTYMTFDEYIHYDIDKATKDYWRQRSKADDFSQQKALIPQIESDKSDVLDKILGGSKVEIRPSGSAEITLGVNYSKNENPAYTINQQTQTSFNFDQKIQLSVIGKIGDRMELKANFNTESMMPTIDNKMNLKYEGEEDDIIKLIEAGNVTMPLNGSLITGSQTLMGIKTQLQFGKLTVTSVLSRSEGEKKEIQLKGGAQTNEFNISANEYEANKHYFVAQYFRDNYDKALANLPYINSMVNITKMEIWVTNTTGATSNTRNIIAFMDLGELDHYNTTLVGAGTSSSGFPSNDVNNEYSLMTTTYAGIRDINLVTQILGASSVTVKNFLAVQDYEKVTLARKLSESEYTYNPQLGYISLNSTLNSDEVLAVAFQYTLGGQVYQVGEFSTDISSEDAIIVKMLKSTNINTKLPTWDLMMKNVYSLGSYQINKDRFQLDVLYTNDETGTNINYIPESSEPTLKSTTLLKVLGLDQINVNQEAKSDGLFDFIEGVTINSSNGRIYFPVLEPFGAYLRTKFTSNTTANNYVYEQLYSETQAAAQQFPDKNKFRIAGTYQSTFSNRISLNAMNIPAGSVTVTANGTTLTENVDYTVDYTIGQVTIINQGLLNSGANINVSYEANNMFNFTSKTFMGTHLDYRISDNFNLGATILNLRERPFTYKVNIGDEPINNTIWGFNGDYYTESRTLTKILDKLPFYNTKTPSTISVKGEFAHLIPGHAKVIGDEGNAYIDDFEGSQSGIDLKTVGAWRLAAIPQGQTSLFPEASLNDDITTGFNRAKLAWYNVDPILIREEDRPSYYTVDDAEKNHYQRLVFEKEIFPKKENPQGTLTNIPVLDLAYYPLERGPYNYDVNVTNYSAGVDANGTLNEPASRWAGITREIQTNDFEAANVQFIEFWVLDPFIYNPNSSGGQLYFNVGNISEDVLKDSRRSFENGLPGTATVENVDTTSWGRVSNTIEIVDVFNSEESSRQYQDVGLDGLGDVDESSFFKQQFLDALAAAFGTSSAAYLNASDDPSSDNYHYFLGDDLDNAKVSILKRYKQYNGMEGNTNTSTMDETITAGKYVTQSSTLPNDEDANNDKNLSESESYFQYVINLKPDDMVVGENYIINAEKRTVSFSDGGSDEITWYQFRIPLQEPDAVVGSIQDFRSIRFLRMFLKGFEDSVILRFATLELVRGEWRTYNFDLNSPGEYIPNDDDPTTFDVANVNYEEHGSKDPVNYCLPPGISREQDYSLNQLVAQNEQSLQMKVCNLEDGDARAAYKNTQFDLRAYKKLKMFLHAETVGEESLKDGEVTAFIRLGSDFIDNYYEYEVPLKVTPAGDYNCDLESDLYLIWPLENQIELELDKLYDAKIDRNKFLQDPNSGVKVNIPYIVLDGNNKISIVGNPNLSNVRTIMIGVRNPTGGDYLAKCTEVWINELRMTDFNESGGWAAMMNVNTKLADLGTLTMAGNITTFGFGSIDKNVSERSRENVYQYDVSSSIDLKKFLPQKVPVTIPMYVGQTETVSNPQYNPLDPDILFSDALDGLPADQQDSLKRIAQTYHKMQSINFTNVKFTKVTKPKKEKKAEPLSKPDPKNPMKTPQKPKGPVSLPFDPSNFTFTYAYTEGYSRDITVEHDIIKTHKGSVAYAWSPTRPNYAPFKKLPLMSSISKSILSNYTDKEKELKQQLQTFKAENRSQTEIKNLEKEIEEVGAKKTKFTAFSKKALASGWWQPVKDINFYLVPGNITVQNDLDRYFQENLRRNTSTADLLIYPTFNKQFNWNRSYNLKYDLTTAFKVDFTATNAARIDEPEGRIDTQEERDSVWENIGSFGRNLTYHHTLNVSYTLPINKTPLTNWITTTAKYSANYDWIAAPPAIENLGNAIQNSNTKQINGQFNFVKFYSKVKYLDKVDKKFSAKKKPSIPKKGPEEKEDASKVSDSTTTKKPKKEPGPTVIDYTFRTLMSLRNVTINYSETNGIYLPGYKPQSQIIGQDWNANAPGLPFLFGDQADIRPLAIEHEWITKDTALNQLYQNTLTQNLSIKASVEPIPNFKIDLSADRNYSLNHQEYFRADANGNYQSFSPTESGNFTITFLPIGSAFDPYQKDGNQAFQNFKAYTKDIAARLAAENPNYDGTVDSVLYPVGYGLSSQEVLIPAFIAAYSGQNPNDPKFSTSPFPKIPMPNWSLTYDGLSNVQFLKKYFSKVSLTHGYKSTYSVSSFSTDLNYEEQNGFSSTYNTTGNFISEYLIYDVQITEQFSPLMGVNVTMNNSMTAKVEYRKERTLGMSLSNYQINERDYKEVVVGLGYKIKDVVIPYKLQGVKKKLKSDLDLKATISVKDEKVVLRKFIEDLNEEFQGGKIFTINLSADYLVSKRLSIRLFFDRTATNPFVPSSYRTVTASSGITFRFTLSQ